MTGVYFDMNYLMYPCNTILHTGVRTGVIHDHWKVFFFKYLSFMQAEQSGPCPYIKPHTFPHMIYYLFIADSFMFNNVLQSGQSHFWTGGLKTNIWIISLWKVALCVDILLLIWPSGASFFHMTKCSFYFVLSNTQIINHFLCHSASVLTWLASCLRETPTWPYKGIYNIFSKKSFIFL